MNNYISKYGADLEKSIDFFRREISALRTGRANPAILENIKVEAYDNLNPLNTVANISVVDARNIIVSAWDKSILLEIEKALLEANLGLGLVNDGEKIRLTVASLTEETRLETVRKLNEKLEAARISIRQIRESCKAEIEAGAVSKEIAEDEKFRLIKELDGLIARKNNELKELRDKKELDIMEI